MSLFQTQVERQFLVGITTDLNPIYNKFLTYFGDPVIQANILEVKEEQYQGEFIRALFVDVLGYTAQPQPNFNLLREKKNETDSKSADAAISINNKIVAVIELKDHKTQDLKKVEVQAFGYKNNHKNCHYIVTSNFERLRFYIDNAVDFIEFDLFNLTFDDFRRLWLCISYESIAKNLPQEIKNQSISSEDVITKKLYKDYSVFKRLLFDNIVLLNPEHDKLLLFKKTQKLLDRFLFLFFAEDKNLLPANSIQGTVEKWKKFNADPMNDYQSLYSRYVKYFKLLDEGYMDNNIEIYAYNGGLFANDELLNQIKVNDDILAENVLKLAAYDYDTDVDVNILGHIFENSLSEIDEVITEINKGVKTISKRKQDGVIYTPRYITQYIVENTIGRLCEEKKQELGIGEELFEYKRADKRKQALKVFDTYRDWLLQITIVDPACGSGAFLNSALDFLIAEHKWIDSQQEKIAGLKGHYSMQLANIENTILENNLFGVDINEESVEIAKLSLWLRTAKPHRKLSSLNNNIKCGNSLIDDPAVAGDKAFDWHKEFPQVFGREQTSDDIVIVEKAETPDYLKLIKEKSVEAQAKAEQGIALSTEALIITKQLAEYVEKLELVSEPATVYDKLKKGFDVVIGNPPYVVYIQSLFGKATVDFVLKNYHYAEYNPNTYALFTELGTKILKSNGYLGYIMPNSWMHNKYFSKMRSFVYSLQVNEIVYLKNTAFQEIVETVILLLENKIRISNKIKLTNDALTDNFVFEEFDTEKYKGGYNPFVESSDCIIVKMDLNKKIKDYALVYRGLETKDNQKYISDKKIDENYKPILLGKDVNKYNTNYSGSFVNFIKKEMKSNANEAYYNRNKILMRRTGSYIIADLDISKSIALKNLYLILPNEENIIYCILAQLNSKLFNYYHKAKTLGENKAFAQFSGEYIESFPCRIYPNYDNRFQLLLKTISVQYIDFYAMIGKFQRMLQRKFNLEELPVKLQNWYLLSYKEFIAELGKKKVKLTLAQEAEWEEYFLAEQGKATQQKKQIDDTDREIDHLVYELYELTEDEVRIVEGK
jgi:hypothetical protein